MKKQTIVIAIGGNSLIKDEDHRSVADQYAAVVETARHIVDLVARGFRVVITHGNGPQVGFILLRSEHSRGLLHEVPLDSIGADTQGAIGYQIQQAMQNEFRRRGLKETAATVVTQALVDKNDPAFQKPTKPIGQFYKKEQADDRIRVEKWTMVEDAGRGWRRVVASPKPTRIIEAEAIKHLVASGCVVIAAGGGGIPVVQDDQGNLSGAAAVIDKDLASAVLAKEIAADLLVISTRRRTGLSEFRQTRSESARPPEPRGRQTLHDRGPLQTRLDAAQNPGLHPIHRERRHRSPDHLSRSPPASPRRQGRHTHRGMNRWTLTAVAARRGLSGVKRSQPRFAPNIAITPSPTTTEVPKFCPL